MTIYVSPKYCIYLTSYFGSKLPPFYIGSSTVDRINSGYRGSIKSKKYKNIWESELKENPHLFKTKIINYYYSRKMALYREKNLQKSLNVVKSCMYVNMSIATPNGFFGMDVSGKNNPAYNRNYKPKKETKNKLKNYHKNNPKVWMNLNNKSKHVIISQVDKFLCSGWNFGRGSLRRKKTTHEHRFCCCIFCKREIQVSNLSNHQKVHI
jgi:hypothetical protein